MKRLFMGKDKFLFLPFILLLLCWISWFAFMFCWLRVFERGEYSIAFDQLSDIFMVVWVLLLCIFPLISIIGIVWQLKVRSRGKALLLSFMTILHVIAYFLLANWGISVSAASVSILSKRAEKTECYFTVNMGSGIELACNKKTYDVLIVDEDVQYAIAFRVLTPYSRHGFLEVIDLDASDNRR